MSSSKPVSQQNKIQRFFLPYLRWTRLLQNWPLFVPTPRHFAMKYHAEILFAKGNTKTWQRPYPPNWDFFPRHLSYSFQKWDLASNYLESSNILWTDLALYIEKIHRDPENPPVKITYIRSIARWPPPNSTGYAFHDDSELVWQDSPLFTYNLIEKRLE